MLLPIWELIYVNIRTSLIQSRMLLYYDIHILENINYRTKNYLISTIIVRNDYQGKLSQRECFTTNMLIWAVSVFYRLYQEWTIILLIGIR